MSHRFCFTDDQGQLWFKEALTESVGNCFRIDELIYEDSSDHHHIILFENETHGRVLAMDGLVQVSRSDEFVYHEMVAHVPAFAHGQLKSVAVVGGGDGGAMRELLRHTGIETITLIEIDKDVVDFSRKWLPEVSNGSFDDPRVEIVIADGVEYMKTTDKRFDLIIIDSSDPVGPSAVLFTPEFYASCKDKLKDNGILVTQNGLASIYPDVVRDSSRCFADLFAHQGFYAITVPTFSGGIMTLGFATDNATAFSPDPAELHARFQSSGLPMRYYTPDLHVGAFALPADIQALVA
ncbi:polyamine aminopropyltransferase [Maricaulis sp. D1M11]|uniref:polyamine aminopropyltransferase n=1 Tax=Maricaulis sp. D1M11 TaxID=3076117 RepID=UPI0039B4A3A4